MKNWGHEVIDFHTHPFDRKEDNICSHKEYLSMSFDKTVKDMRKMGVSCICGSVIRRIPQEHTLTWEDLHAVNETAAELADRERGFFVPGFHVHPGFLRESLEEIERMDARGIRLIGELVPYHHRWRDYSCREMDEILALAAEKNMIVSIHSMGEDEMDAMVKKHPDVIIVAAHPGEYGEFTRHMERMKFSENYYLDLSGYGIFRHGMLRHAVDLFGAERFLYGSDFPTCNPAMYLGGVELDPTITDAEREKIMGGNARALLTRTRQAYFS